MKLSKLPPSTELVSLSTDGKPGKVFQLKSSSIASIQPYEKVAQEAVNKFLAEGYHKVSDINPRYLSRMDQLVAAEQVLVFVARFHESARQRTGAKGTAGCLSKRACAGRSAMSW